MNTKRVLNLFFALFFISMVSFAQSSESPIKWRMSVKMTSATEGTVTLRAIVAKGWHLYGTSLPKDGPVPTTFNFDASTGIKFLGGFTASEKPVTKNDANFGMKLSWWEKNVTFTRKFRLTGSVKDAVISGSVRFMGCNDLNCLAPATQNFKTKVNPYTPAK